MKIHTVFGRVADSCPDEGDHLLEFVVRRDAQLDHLIGLRVDEEQAVVVVRYLAQYQLA